MNGRELLDDAAGVVKWVVRESPFEFRGSNTLAGMRTSINVL